MFSGIADLSLPSGGRDSAESKFRGHRTLSGYMLTIDKNHVKAMEGHSKR